jgi:hypothetical protein
LQHGLIGLHRLLGGFVGRDRLIDLLLRGDLLGEQLLLAPKVAGGLRKCRVVLCELRLVAGYEGLDLTIVEGEEQIALPDELTVRDMLLQHLAVDARADNDDCGSRIPMVRRRITKSLASALTTITGTVRPMEPPLREVPRSDAAS